VDLKRESRILRSNKGIARIEYFGPGLVFVWIVAAGAVDHGLLITTEEVVPGDMKCVIVDSEIERYIITSYLRF
jgi:hypothetical protein